MGGCVGKEATPATQGGTGPADDKGYAHIFKIVILGDVNVGKSCVLLRYLQNVFTETVATIGEDNQGTKTDWPNVTFQPPSASLYSPSSRALSLLCLHLHSFLPYPRFSLSLYRTPLPSESAPKLVSQPSLSLSSYAPLCCSPCDFSLPFRSHYHC